jgi:hypothetical protein
MKSFKGTVLAFAGLGLVACGGPKKQVSTKVPLTPAAVELPAPSRPDAPVVLDLAFVTHLDANLPEQDVFIEREPGSGQVYRVTKGDHDLLAPLFAAAHTVQHNPFDPKAVGPYPKGAPLGMNLGQWLAQAGGGTYACSDGVGTLDLEFRGLVPNGVYTMWHAFIALPATEPFTGTLDLPLGARDGSESVFAADGNGVARFQHSFSPCLEMSGDWTTSMLALNYHSDGRTYKADPGEFGLHAHVPLFVMLPRADEVADERSAQR